MASLNVTHRTKQKTYYYILLPLNVKIFWVWNVFWEGRIVGVRNWEYIARSKVDIDKTSTKGTSPHTQTLFLISTWICHTHTHTHTYSLTLSRYVCTKSSHTANAQTWVLCSLLNFIQRFHSPFEINSTYTPMRKTCQTPNIFRNMFVRNKIQRDSTTYDILLVIPIISSQGICYRTFYIHILRKAKLLHLKLKLFKHSNVCNNW